MVDEFRTLDRELCESSPRMPLRIGASYTVGTAFLPPILQKLSREPEPFRCEVVIRNTALIETALLESTLDIAILEGAIHSRDLIETVVGHDEVIAVIQPGREKTDDCPWILREPGSGTLAVWQSALRHKNIPLTSLRVIAHIGHSESIKRFIMHSEAMAILSVRAVSQEVFDGTLKIIDIKDLPLERMFHIVRRQGQENSVAEKFLQYLLKHKPDLCIP